MALRLARSLIEKRGVDVEDIGEQYLEWWREGAFDTGPIAARVLELVDTGLTFDDASQRVHQGSRGLTAGVNPAHRAAPLAMLASLEDGGLVEAAKAEARLTHRHPLAGDVSAAVACLARALIRGFDWRQALSTAEVGRLPETVAALDASKPASVDPGGFAPAVLAAAVHFVEGSANFRSALLASIKFAGPANYCPVLVGSIGGARWGAASIDEDLLGHNAEMRDRVRVASEVLADGWAR